MITCYEAVNTLNERPLGTMCRHQSTVNILAPNSLLILVDLCLIIQEVGIIQCQL